MHLSALITVNFLTITAFALQPHPRQAITTPAAEFSSAAAQLLSLYLPSSIQSAILSAASAASVTGDPASIVESAFTAAATPAWFSALPTQYSSNVLALESALSQLKGQASTGLPGAPRVVTVTNSAGSTVVSVTGGATGAISSAKSAESSAASALSSALSSASEAASSALASASSVASSVAGSVSSVLSSASASVAAASSSRSSGFAVPTQVPIDGAAAGVLGILGVVLAL